MVRYGWPLVALTALAAFVAWSGHRPIADDASFYVAMAAHPCSGDLAHYPPFCWRILTPLLVFLLPLPTVSGFWVVTLVGLAGAALALMWFLRGLDISPAAAVAGGLAFACLMPATGFTLYDDALVDPLAFALLTLALAAAVHRKGWLVLLALALCALDKEVAIFGAVFALAWSWQHHDKPMMRWSIVSVMSVLALITLVHVLILSSIPYSLLLTAVVFIGVTAQQPARLLLAIVGAWGVLLPLAAYARAFWRNPACWLLLLLATLQVFVSSDIERVVVYAFPVMIAASCLAVEALAKRWRVSRWWLWLPVFALELSWQYTWGPDYFFTLASLHTALMVTLLLAALAVLGWRLASTWRASRLMSHAEARGQDG